MRSKYAIALYSNNSPGTLKNVMNSTKKNIDAFSDAFVRHSKVDLMGLFLDIDRRLQQMGRLCRLSQIASTSSTE